MKVYYKTVVIPAGRYSWGTEYPESYEYHDMEKVICCEEMNDAWNDSYIAFAPEWRGSANICIEKQGYGDPDYLSIKFCPFCASKIECIEKERVRRVIKKKSETKEVTTEYTEEVPA